MPFLTKTKSNFNSRKTVKSPLKQGYVPFMRGNLLYDGTWLNNKQHGFGIFAQKKGNIFLPRYKGNYYEGKKDGPGNYYYKDGSYYTGQWKKGFRWGFGKMWYSDGSFYGGYWKCDKRHGAGLFVDVDGNRYEGCWVSDEKHGLGRLFHLITGQMQEGAWFKDAAICTTIEDIPFRKTVISASKYPIKELGLQNPDDVIFHKYLDIYANDPNVIIPVQTIDSVASSTSDIIQEIEFEHSKYVKIY